MNHETQQANGLPAGWVWTTLGEVATINRRDPALRELPDDLQVTFLPMSAVDALSGTIVTPEERRLGELRKGFSPFSEGDVLFAKITPSMENGKATIATGLINGRGFGSTEFHVLSPADVVTADWLFYLLRQESFRADAKASFTGTAGQLRVPASFLERHRIPLPPLPEQHRIVAEIETQFTRLDAGVAALKRVQAKLRRYKAAVLKAACEGHLVPTEAELARVEGREYEPAAALVDRILAERRAKWEQANPGRRYVEPKRLDVDGLAELPEGWVWASVEQVADQRLGKMLDKVKNKGTLLPYLRNINVRWFGFDLTDMQEMRVKDEELDDISVRAGDLVVCEGGEPGRAAVWNRPDESVVIQKALHRVRPFVGVSVWYLAYRLAADAGTGGLERYFTGSTIKHFTGQSSRAYAFSLPPTAEQHRIVAEVERRLSVAQEVESTVAASLRRAERLRQSILKRAFEGRLIPQDQGAGT